MLGEKNKIRVLFFGAFALLIGGLFLCANANNVSAQQNSALLDVSAYILNQENKEIPNGKYKIRFAIYNTDKGGSALWQETQEVELTNGIFNAYLGAVNPLPKSLNFDEGAYYLGIKIGDDQEASPRKKIGYVPAAWNAHNAGNAQRLQGATIGTGNGDILQLGKNGKIDLKRLPTGTGNKKLVLGNDSRLHKQNTDTGTKSREFNIGNKSSLTAGNFDLTVSNAANKPTIRFNYLTQKWQYSEDGITFSSLGTVDVETTGITSLTSSNSGLEISSDGLRLLGGCSDGQILTWEASSETWTCTDNTAGSSNWTDTGTLTYLTDIANDFVLGGTNQTNAAFYFDVSRSSLQLNPYGANAGETGEMRFLELVSNGTNYVGLKAPDSISSNQVWTLPSADGNASQVLTTDGNGHLQWLTAGAGLGAPIASQYVTLANDSGLDSERVLTGTANQIIITDGGANSTVTLSTPQDIATTSSPTFAGITLSGLSTDGVVITSSGVLSSEAQLAVARGGTGSATFTAGSVVFSNGTILTQDNSNFFWDDTNDRLGIGTNTPSQQLELTGNMELADTTYANQNGIIYKNGIPFIHNFNYGDNGTVTTEGHNLFIGENAGNFTMGSTATAAWQASYSVGIGDQSLQANTVGTRNVANGYRALYSNTTGNNNVANGYETLYFNNAGSNNTADGALALSQNATGSNNTALGYYAGRYIADGLTGNTTGDYNVFLGSNTKALADGDQNEIVIGYDATGVGSNSVVLGNDSITTTVLKGNVGIGTTSPTAYLDVSASTTSQASLRFRSGVAPTTPNAGDIYSDGTNIYFYNGSSWDDLTNTGVSTFLGLSDTPSSYTAGSVLFTSGSAVTQDNSNFFWDDTNNRLGIGTTTPSDMLDIYGTSNALRLSYDSTNYGTLSVNSSGEMSFSTSSTTDSALVLGTGLAEDTLIIYEGNAQDYHIGLDDTDDSFKIGLGSTLGTTDYLTIDSSGNVALSSLSTDGVVITSSGVLSSEAQLAVARGGTGSATFTAGSVVFSNGTILTQDNSNFFWDDTNNRLGIGTAAPSDMLDIYGTSNALRLSYDDTNYTTLSSDSVGGLSVSSTSTGSGSRMTIGSGIAEDTLIIFDGEDVAGQDYHIGLDDTDDSFKIGLGGTLGTTDYLTIDSSGNVALSSLSTDGPVIATSGTLSSVAQLTSADGGTGIDTSSSTGVATVSAGTWSISSALGVTTGGTGTSTQFTQGSIVFAGASGVYSQDNSNFFWDDTNNRLGIGTTTPSDMLDIYGTSNALRLSYDSTNYGTLSVNSSGEMSFSTSSTTDSALVLGTGLAEDTLIIFDGEDVAGQDYHIGLDDTDDSFKIGLGGTLGTTDYLTINSSGNIGIGTATPSQQLEITQNMQLADTTSSAQYGIIYKNGTPFIHNFNYGDNGTVTTDGHNIFIGKNAGNLTMGSTATSAGQASYNIAIGDNSLYSNTTGYQNIANGYQALYSNTTGYYNIAVGYESLYYNTTANSNVGVGRHSLFSTTIGGVNTAVGSYALSRNTTGAGNVAIGGNAGIYIINESGYNQTGWNNVFVGRNTKALADGDQNEIVIGYNATGFGSNTITLGSDSIITSILKGDVVVPMTTPTGVTATLGVTGTLSGTYYYKVSAYDGVGWTNVSSEVSGTVDGGTTNGTITVAWTAVTGATNYRVWRGTSANGETEYYETTSTSLADDGSLTFTAGTPPSVTGAYVNKLADYGDSWLLGGSLGIGTSSPTGLEVTQTVDEVARGVDNVRLGVYAGTPRIIFEDSSASNQWEIDNSGGNLRFFQVGSTKMTINSSGNVGIGTTSPTALLHLNGVAGTVGLEINSNETTSTNNVLMLRSDVAADDDAIFRVQADGAVYADGAYTGTGADYAEYFYTKDTDLEAGEVVCVDTARENAVKRCQNSGDNNIMGIVSSKPSVIGNGGKDENGIEKSASDNYVIVGMLGQIPAKVTDENGAINVGDSLTSSSMPGYLRKADTGEATVGIALENSLAGNNTIQVMISRKNKSLTVENVEQEVQDRIANMEIEDQVNQIIANGDWMLEVNARLSALESPENGDGTLLTELQKQIDNIKEQLGSVDSAGGIISDIETLKESNATLVDFMLAMDGDKFIRKNDEGNLLLDGKLRAKAMQSGKIIIEVSDKKTATIGEGKICGVVPIDENDDHIDDCSGNHIPYDEDNDGKDDETEKNMPIDENKDWIDDETNEPIVNDGRTAIIKTKAVNKNSKIFVTPKNTIEQPLAVTKIKDNKNFTVEVKSPVKKEVDFDWWIVDATQSDVN